MGKPKQVNVSEVRIGWTCPHCNGRMWVGTFSGKKTGKQKCVYCKKEIIWSLTVQESL